MAAKPAHRWRHKNPNTAAEAERRARYASADHREARARFTILVEAGVARCWRPHCRKRLAPGGWHVGHNDAGTVIMGPECVTCNRKAAAIKGGRIVSAQRKAKRFVRAVR